MPQGWGSDGKDNWSNQNAWEEAVFCKYLSTHMPLSCSIQHSTVLCPSQEVLQPLLISPSREGKPWPTSQSSLHWIRYCKAPFGSQVPTPWLGRQSFLALLRMFTAGTQQSRSSNCPHGGESPRQKVMPLFWMQRCVSVSSIQDNSQDLPFPSPWDWPRPSLRLHSSLMTTNSCWSRALSNKLPTWKSLSQSHLPKETDLQLHEV